jgi:hypothetical protein
LLQEVIMTARLEEVLKKLSPAQLEMLLAQAEEMARAPHPKGRKLRLDWAHSIDSEHTTGLDAQRAAMESWKKSLERNP